MKLNEIKLGDKIYYHNFCGAEEHTVLYIGANLLITTVVKGIERSISDYELTNYFFTSHEAEQHYSKKRVQHYIDHLSLLEGSLIDLQSKIFIAKQNITFWEEKLK